MSDSYKIGDVTVTSNGGGVYQLSHASLETPETVRGKEKADARAQEIVDANKSSDEEGSMEAQGLMIQQGDLTGPIPGEPSEAQKVHAAEIVKAPEEANDETKDAEIASLRAQLAQSEKRNEELTKASDAVVKTVQAQAEPDEPTDGTHVSAQVPRRYVGEMDATTRGLLKKMGMGVTRIVLEENETIPPTGLYLGHNGRGYMISPGVEVDVPDFLLGVLDDAIMSAPVVDSKSQKVLGYRNRMRYPYRKIG